MMGIRQCVVFHLTVFCYFKLLSILALYLFSIYVGFSNFYTRVICLENLSGSINKDVCLTNLSDSLNKLFCLEQLSEFTNGDFCLGILFKSLIKGDFCLENLSTSIKGDFLRELALEDIMLPERHT